MIFDFQSANDISDAELASLVADGRGERQHLEYKAVVILDNDSRRLEFLKDVVSIANGGGGYLIVGINDNGTGNADGYSDWVTEQTEGPLIQQMRDLALEHIEERLPSLEVIGRLIDGHRIIVMRVPSDKAPHMVTFNNNTTFCTRNTNGKLEMRHAEIKAMFRDDFLSRQVADVASNVNALMALFGQGQTSTPPDSKIRELSGRALLEERFKQIGQQE